MNYKLSILTFMLTNFLLLKVDYLIVLAIGFQVALYILILIIRLTYIKGLDII